MAVKYLSDIEKNYKIEQLIEISKTVEIFSKKTVNSMKPIVGKDVFSHESGIHVDGLLKNENTYELFDPKELGRNRQFIIGKHTGIAGIINKFNELGKHIDNDTAKKIILKIRNELEINKNFDINNYLIKYVNSNKQEVFYDD